MVADPDPGKSEGGDSREVRRVGGGGWAEDMEGRSGLTLLLHTPVLSLTLVYIIFLVCSSQQLPDSSGQRTLSLASCSHDHGRHRCDFFIIRKELGKGGGGVESSGYQCTECRYQKTCQPPFTLFYFSL